MRNGDACVLPLLSDATTYTSYDVTGCRPAARMEDATLPGVDSTIDPAPRAAVPAPSVPAMTAATDGVVAPSGTTTQFAVPASSKSTSTVIPTSVIPLSRGKPLANTGATTSKLVVI